MPKPWAKYEIGFIGHDKFRAINANAICLWLEGKNYADSKLTDGLLPIYEVKLWRFYGPKALAMLTTSCGLKPGTSQFYAPLWEPVDGFGWMMHDYLAHNDCREEAQERIAQRERERERDREYKRLARAAKRAKREGVSDARPVDVRSDVRSDKSDKPPDVRVVSGSIQITEDRRQKTEEQQKSGGGRKERPQFSNQRFAVHRWQVDELISMLGAQVDTFDLDEWLLTGAAERARQEPGVIPDWWKWLKTETLREAQRRGLPMALTAVDTDDAMWAAIAKKGPSVRP